MQCTRQERPGRALVTIESSDGWLSVDPLGARVVQYAPHGHEGLLWAPAQAYDDPQVFPHAGIPLCWPWFANPPRKGLPFHGLARSQVWEVEIPDPTVASLRLHLPADRLASAGWPVDLTLTVAMTSDGLHLALVAINHGQESLVIGEALHAYMRVGDKQRCTLRGLEGAAAVDKQAGRAPITLPTAPLALPPTMDLVVHACGDLCLEDPVLGRRLHLQTRHAANTILWSPSQAVCAKVPALGHGQAWREFVCIEPGNCEAQSRTLAPGAIQALGLTLRAAFL